MLKNANLRKNTYKRKWQIDIKRQNDKQKKNIIKHKKKD